MMKKCCIVLTAVLFSLTAAATEDRSGVLKVYNYAEMVTPELVAGFKTWYHNQTGRDITVIYQTYSSDLTAISEIETSHDDWDVLTISPDILSLEIRKGMLQTVDRSCLKKTSTPDYLSNISSYIREQISLFSDEFDCNDYYVPLDLATTGILFNTEKYTREEVSTWDIFQNPEFKGKILMSNNVHDMLYIALINMNAEAVRTGKMTVAQVFRNFSPDDFPAIEEWYRTASEQIAGWDTGFGYDYYPQGKSDIGAVWSCDADKIIAISKETGGPDLDFAIPTEGGYLFSDGMVIPVYAGNPEAAVYWMDYIMSTEVLIANLPVSYITLTSFDPVVIDSIQDVERYPETIDLSYLFPDYPGADSLHLSHCAYIDRKYVGHLAMVDGSVAEYQKELNWLMTRIQTCRPTVRAFLPEILLCAGLIVLFLVRRRRR